MSKLKCWRKVKKEFTEKGTIHFEHKKRGFHAKVWKNPNGEYVIMEYVGNRTFPASPPTLKKRISKEKAIKEAKRYINQFKC